METRNLQFCFYYKGAEECPYDRKSPDYDNDAGFAWMSEAICCKADDMDVDRFLDFICAHMGKWDPYDYVDRFCRYQSLLFVLCGNPGKEFLGFFFCKMSSFVMGSVRYL